MRGRFSDENAWTASFAPDLIEHAFVGYSLSDSNFIEVNIFMNHAVQLTNICAPQITSIYTIVL